MSDCVVYWLFDETCICPRLHGYVGISARFANRLKDHRVPGRFPVFNYAVLLKGSEAECFALEKSLRPDHNIGWNRAKGGPNQGRTLGYKYTEASKAKMSAALTGRQITWGDKLSAAGKGQSRTQAAKDAVSRAHKGKPKSAEQRAKMSEAARLRYQNPIERERMSAAVKAGKARSTSN